MEQRAEKLFSDLGSMCLPRTHVSQTRERYKWNSVSYQTADVSGNMLVSLGDGRPPEVSLDPELTGWYRIYVGQAVCWILGYATNLNLKLKSWSNYMHFCQEFFIVGRNRQEIQESFWCCADMTGETVQIAKEAFGKDQNATLAWLRFVPMSREEVEQFKADQLRRDTKRLYAANDMHTMMSKYGYSGRDKWFEVVDEYRQSDVGWLSLENLLWCDGELSTQQPDNFAYPIATDREVQAALQKDYNAEMLRDVIEYGHKQGLKMSCSLRMGAWGIDFPYDQMYFDNKFAKEHSDLQCLDRDGTEMGTLSYIYPEVQDYVIDLLLKTARQGCDAVELMAHRGAPYVMFEEPFVRRFMDEYGEDPRYLPLDDSRVNALHCQIMTEFFRKLRQRLNEETGENKVRIHLRTLYSLWDSRSIGLDAQQLAAEGLINAVITYPKRVCERIDADLLQEDGVHIDLEKYAQRARRDPSSLIRVERDFNTVEPVADSRGELCGPADQQERVSEWMQLEKQYGCEVFFEIMPCNLRPALSKERALELYRCGAERISLWDTHERVLRKACWSMMRRLGHKEELEQFSAEEGENYRVVRVLDYDGQDVSRYFPSWGG